jgi:hypothetical protein
MNIIRTVAHLMQQQGMCRMEACRDVNIHPPFMHLKWMKQAQTIIERKRMNVRARSTYVGRIGCLAEHTEEWLSFIFELREKGMVVTVPMVVRKALQISDVFRNKSALGKIPLRPQVYPFTWSCVSHWDERIPALTQEVAAEAIDYDDVRPKVMEATRQYDYILNIDQTPVPFTYNTRKVYMQHQVCHLCNDIDRIWKGFETSDILKGFEAVEMSNVSFQIMII